MSARDAAAAADVAVNQEEKEDEGVRARQYKKQLDDQNENILLLTKSKLNIKCKSKGESSNKSNKMPTQAENNQESSSNSKQQQQLKQLAASLRSAANEGKVELVRLLLRCGANVNAQDEEFGNTALHQAAWNGFSETIQVLCKHRASTSIKNKAQFTPLHLACQQGHNQSARLLLMAGARPDAKNSYGDTPLHTAARYGHAGVARICLSAKCNPNQVNKNDDTPLHIAAAMGRRKLTKILMQNGAEPAIKNKQNETAMDIALRKDLIEIQELIANPPASSSRKQRRQTQMQTTTTTSCNKYKSSSQLELLLGSLGQSGDQLLCSQLYSSSRLLHPTADDNQFGNSSNGQDQCNRHKASHTRRHKSSRRHHFRSSHDFQHKLLLSDEELEHLEDDDYDRELELRRATRAGRSSVEPTRTARQLARDSNVTPVDAGPTSGRRLAVGARRAGCQFTSESALNSVAMNERAVDVGGSQHLSQRVTRVLPLRRLRTRTLVNGLEHAGPSELEQRQQLKGGTFVIRPSSVGSVRRSIAEQLQDLTLQAAAEGHAQQPIEPDELGPLEASAHLSRQRRYRVSPTGSARSSTMSKSRTNRLVLRPRRLTECASPPTTGGKLSRCMGNLSLLQLRNMVNKRAAQRKKQQKRFEEVDRKRAAQNQSSQEDNDEKLNEQHEQQCTATTSGGRRQERFKREMADANCSIRAPNGIKLLNSRPLAPLNDETQLYAIPRKNMKTGGTIASTGNGDTPAKQQVAGESAKQNQLDDGRALANDGSSAPTPQDTADQPQGSLQPHSATMDGQLQRQEHKRTIKTATNTTTTTTSTLDLVKRANNLAASVLEPPPQTTRQLGAAGPALTGSDSGHSLSTASSTLKTSGEHQARAKDAAAAAADAASNSSAAGSSCDLSSSASNSSGQRRLASLSPGSLENGTANNGSPQRVVGSEERELAAHLVGVRTGEELHYDDRDFCAPGYSVVLDTKRANLKSSTEHQHQLQQHEDTCRCPLGLEERKSSELPAAGESPATILRHYLHLDSKSKSNGLLSQVNEDKRKDLRYHEEEVGDEDENDDDSKQIRPKSALGAANAELIAAQKSLAAAAAAKVQRDRLAKLARSKQETQSLNEQSATNCRLLTVKTTNETPFWLQPQHAHYARGHQTVAHAGHQQQNHSAATVAAVSHSKSASTKMIGTMMNIITSAPAGSHRSGTNSVGMSDSSPSNNGAESDNSIQTTTSGSLNTTASDGTTSATGKSATKSGASSTGPFGILSRILLNNSSKQQAKASSKEANKVTTSSSGKQQNGRSVPAALVGPASSGFNGSISSSSAMSSPSISNGQPTSSQSSPDDASSTATASTAGEQQQHKPKLGQLGSRSRQPIVLSNSNELMPNGKSGQSQPRLPPKGVLKNGVSRNYAEQHEFTARPSTNETDALANGLPRVASYTQLSHQQQEQQHQANLCNYHALNRSHMIQTKYSPYLPYNLGRYSIHETCDPSASEHCGQHQFAYYSAMSNDPLAAYSCTGLSSGYRNTADLLNNTTSDTSMVCNYSHDDSAIYIPPYMSTGGALNGNHYGAEHHQHQTVANSAGGQQHLMVARSAHGFNNVASYAPQHNANSTHLVDFNQQQQRQRPKSSLDSILLNSATGHQNEQGINQSYGQPQKCNGQQRAPTRPILVKRYSHELKLAPQSSHPTLRDDYDDQQCHQSEASHFNVTQNSIYAGQSMLPLKSELTVLPAADSNGLLVKRLDHESLPREQTNGNSDKTTKHKSLVKVNLQMFEKSAVEAGRELPPALPPKSVTVSGGSKQTTRVSINQDWKQVERGAETTKQSEPTEEELDDFSGATVL